ncbi:MAG TPA: guanylate kinase [Balneolaceae bacterium]|nr:guanylate kinase [Balneolaceae bacterium]
MSNESPSGKLIVLVAPSGAGKTTIARKLLDEFPELKFSVSATTRPPREYEKDGVDYFFLSEQEFDELIKKDGFLEWEEYSGYRYGTLRSEVDKMIKNGYFPVLDIEVKGALNVKRIFRDHCVSIFIEPPSIEELERRLLKRGSETKESLEKRLKKAEKELAYANRFDFIVINNKLEAAYKQVKTIIQSFTSDTKN